MDYLQKTQNKRVSVLSLNGNPLMPTKASKARKLIRDGKAVPLRNKLGIFYIQLTFNTQDNTQPMSVGIDPGSSFTGIAVQSTLHTHCSTNLTLPRKQVSKRLEDRAVLRRSRRGRRINRAVPFKLRNHRQKRFSNRVGNNIPPSIKANKQLELKVFKELSRLFPITDVFIEKLNTSKSAGFTRASQGQNWLLKELITNYPTVNFNWKKGYNTSNLRKHLGLGKDKDKESNSFEAHCSDAATLASFRFIEYVRDGLKNSHYWRGNLRLTIGQMDFFDIRRMTVRPKKLHDIQFKKGGVRRSYGGSKKVHPYRNGDVVTYQTKKVKIKGVIQSNDIYGYLAGKWKRLKQLKNEKNLKLNKRVGNMLSLMRPINTTLKEGDSMRLDKR